MYKLIFTPKSVSLHINLKVCDNKIMNRLEQPGVTTQAEHLSNINEQTKNERWGVLKIVDGSFQEFTAPKGEVLLREVVADTIRNINASTSKSESLKGKEGWTEVDLKLKAILIEKRKLKNKTDPESQALIKELEKQFSVLKEEKSPSPKKQGRVQRGGVGGRPNKKGREKLAQTIGEAQKEDALLTKSLKSGEGYVRGGKEAMRAIEEILRRNEEDEDKALSPLEQRAKDGDKLAIEELADLASDKRRAEEIKRKEEEKEMKAPELIPTSNEGLPEIEKIRPFLSPEQINDQALKNAETQKRAMEKLARLDNDIEKRAEKAGPWALNGIRKIDEKWKKFPLWSKVAIGGTLLALGLSGAVVVGSTAAFGVSALGLTLRGLGMVSLFGTFERMLVTEHQKKTDEPRSDAEIKRHAIFAGALAVTIGLLMPKVLSDLIGAESLPVSETLSPGETVVPLESFPNPDPKIEVVTAPTDPYSALTEEKFAELTKEPSGISPEKLAELTTVKEGQGIWHPVEAQVKAANPEWTEAQVDKETHRLLVKNDIINPDGSELRVSKAGMHVILNPDGTITYDSANTYTHTPTLSPEAIATPEAAVPSESLSRPSALDIRLAVESATKVVNSQMSERFGSNGFFGLFGGTPWEKSLDIMDKDVGLAGKSVDEILMARPPAFPEDGVRKFGIESFKAAGDAQIYLNQTAINTGIVHEQGEKFLDYIKRATASGIAATMNKG